MIALGLFVSLIANTASPKGLSLTRNYFKVVAPPLAPGTQPGNSNTTSKSGDGNTTSKPGNGKATRPGNGNNGSKDGDPTTTRSDNGGEFLTEEEMVQRVKDRGFHALYHHEVLELFHSPFRTDGLYVFIDARDDDHYQAGHLPGVLQLDYYYIDRYISAVLDACKIADRIVVYCNGGTCEDSELAVGYLMEKGIEPHRLFIYAGGFTMWRDMGEAVETGGRNSGQITRYPVKTSGSATQETKQ